MEFSMISNRSTRLKFQTKKIEIRIKMRSKLLAYRIGYPCDCTDTGGEQRSFTNIADEMAYLCSLSLIRGTRIIAIIVLGHG